MDSLQSTSNRHKSPRRTPALKPVLVEMAGVVSREVRWLWPGRIPLGKMTLLAGDPGLGKSFLTIDLAARVTTGRAWPDLPGEQACEGEVIFLNAEDDIHDTVCPRLAMAGARLDRCTALTAGQADSESLPRPVSLDRDLAMLRSLFVAKPACRLLVIDPISAFLGKLNGNSNQEVRSLMFPLAQLAAEFNVAVVLVTHLNKRNNARSLYRAMGSLGFVASVRSAWVVLRDEQDPQRQLFLPLKSNLCLNSSGLAYRLRADSPQAIATIAWEELRGDRSPDEVLHNVLGFDRAAQDYRDEEHYADVWLREFLHDGPRPRNEVFEIFNRPATISEKQLYRAAERVGVLKIKYGLLPGDWVWALPEHAQQARESAAEKKRQKLESDREEQRRESKVEMRLQPPRNRAEQDLLEQVAESWKRVMPKRP